MALNKDTRELISSDLTMLTWHECQEVSEHLSNPTKKQKHPYFGGPKQGAHDVLARAKDRHHWIAYDLKVTDGTTSIIQAIEKLESLIAKYCGEESVD